MSNKQLPLFRSSSRSTWSSYLPQSSRKRLILITVLALALFLLLPFHHTPTPATPRPPAAYRIDLPSWPRSPNNNDLRRVSAFSSESFATKALSNEEDLKPVTAVIYRITRNLENIQSVVHHLLQYPFVKEIYIHNPMSAPRLSVEHLGLDINTPSTVNFEIYNENTEHLGSLHRFTTCAMASNEICFMQDDTWRTDAMDTLYLNMIRFPNLIHAVSPPERYLDQMRRRVFNQDISMHAGHLDLQYGAFVPRWKAQTFMTQLGKSALGKDRIRQAEHYFSLWTNQYPWILSAPVVHANDDQSGEPLPPWNPRVYSNFLQAVRRMARTLEEDLTEAPKDYFERFEDDPGLDERDARSPCANDRCLFITNMDMMPHPSNLTFKRDEIAKTEDWEQMYDTLGELPTNEFFATYGYQMAVDQDPNTCWNTFKNPRAGDYFGLILLGDVIPRRLEIGTPNIISGAENFFKVSVTRDGKSWIPCDSTSSQVGNQVHIALQCENTSSEGEATNNTARAIRVAFRENSHEPFNVCGLSLGLFTV